MQPLLAISIATAAVAYIVLQVILHGTQNQKEPCLLETTLPFLDPPIGVLCHRSEYLTNLRKKYGHLIHTLRMPFQRLYVIHAPHLIQLVQSKANAAVFVPNLLDFGMLFSGLTQSSQATLRKAYGLHGNGFTMSVHKYLLSGPSLQAATRTAINKLSASVPNIIANNNQEGLFDIVRHELCLALTGAIYGVENPYDNPEIEASWITFLPGISHLLYSPFPTLTARKALRARGRVMDAFKKYFETGGHLQAFPMIPEMYEVNKGHGLASDEAAKLEMATSLAMLSSGAITTFWFLFQLLSDNVALQHVREELHALARDEYKLANTTPMTKVLDMSDLRAKCPTLGAMLNETLRYHSTVINIKQVQHDTALADQYLLKKNGIVMIPGQSVHHNVDVWGSTADDFDHQRFFSADAKKNLASTSAFRPFGAGTSMCPGRHFSMNVILSLVAMLLLQYDVSPLEGHWTAPTKRKADMWNAMPKPDWDVGVRLVKREAGMIDWKFVWAEGASET